MDVDLFDESDKRLHMQTYACVAGVIELATIPIELKPGERFIVATGGTLITGFVQEFVLGKYVGHPNKDWRDFGADVVGCLAVTLPVYGVEWYVTPRSVGMSYNF